MQVKPIIAATLLALSMTACSTIQKVVYRIDVPQGNLLEASKVAQVQPGMNLQQVQYILGTPVLIEPFNNHEWYYVYLEQRGYEDPEQHTFVVSYDNRGIVTNVNLDKPLTNEEIQEINNSVINIEAPEKRWYQFWK